LATLVIVHIHSHTVFFRYEHPHLNVSWFTGRSLEIVRDIDFEPVGKRADIHDAVQDLGKSDTGAIAYHTDSYQNAHYNHRSSGQSRHSTFHDGSPYPNSVNCRLEPMFWENVKEPLFQLITMLRIHSIERNILYVLFDVFFVIVHHLDPLLFTAAFRFFRSFAVARERQLRTVEGFSPKHAAISVNFIFSKKRKVMTVWYFGFRLKRACFKRTFFSSSLSFDGITQSDSARVFFTIF